MSTLEQSFNPDWDDITRRENFGQYNFFIYFCQAPKRFYPSLFCAGYPRWLSGDLRVMSQVAEKTQTGLFPDPTDERPWEDVNSFKRFYLSFPFYPLRTLCPREIAQTKVTQKYEFDPASAIIPANTQINLVFSRRDANKLINYIVPYNLNPELGSSRDRLTAEERKIALTFSLVTPPAADAPPGTAGTRRSYVISQVRVVLNDLYLQV